MRLFKKYKLTLIFFTVFCGCSLVFANPVIGNIGAGNISIQQAPGSTTINQTSGRGIINWNSFNINANESTHFNQPAGGVTLNRISPLQGASQIYGRLTATGQIILVNPAGIYFGPGAYVNVGGLIASTGSISDRDFLAGKLNFTQDWRYAGSIVNQGTIIAADHGLVALMGNAVQNDGTIQANLGHAILGSGSSYSLTFADNNNISFVVNSPVYRRGLDKNGNALPDGIRNSGRIIANGGNVIVTAAAASGVLDNVINMRGYVEAQSAQALPGGGVALNGIGGTVRVASNIKAKDVSITGTNIAIDSPTTIDVSGDTGGRITIGRDSNGVLAQNTSIASGVNLLANGINGDGGLIETSGNHLNIGDINVSTKSEFAKTGTWLLDPTNLTIYYTTVNVAQAGSTFTGLQEVSYLHVDTLLKQLATTNVKVQTTSGGNGAGDLTVAASINWNTPYTLTLSAYRNLIINNGITIANPNSLGGLLLEANNAAAFSYGSGQVIDHGTINMAGNVNIFTNPSDASYTPALYRNIGAGTLKSFMLINNVGQLQTVLNNSTIWNKSLALNVDINASTLAGYINSFGGELNGRGHFITNLTENLMNKIASNASVHDLGLTGVINGGNNVGLLAAMNAGTISRIMTFGKVTGSDAVGGLVGSNTGVISDVENLAAVNGNTNAGGIAGTNSGSISNAISVASVNGTGAIAGTNSGVSNSYYDSDATGIAGGNTFADLTQAATYNSLDFNNTWGIIAGESYPYLKSLYPTAPRAISGQIGEFTAYRDNPAWAPMDQTAKNPLYESYTPIAANQQEVTLGVNGNVIDKTYAGANGRYYFLEKNIADGSALLTYLSNSSDKANSITVAPAGNRSLHSLDMALNTVLVANNGYYTTNFLNPNYSGYFDWLPYPNDLTSINQADVVSAIKNIQNPDILYNTNVNDILLNPQINFVMDPHTFYILSGNITADQGSITSNAIVAVNPLNNNSLLTLKTMNEGNIFLYDVLYPAQLKNSLDYTNMPETTLFINSANNIILWGHILGRTGQNIPVDAKGSLTLSAAYTDQSITTGPIRYSGSNSVRQFLSLMFLDNFTMLQGKFYQNDQADPTIATSNNGVVLSYYYPRFAIFNDFTLGTGVYPYTNIEFVRTGGGDGSEANPYIIFDIYGLQGIGSNERLLQSHYQLGGENVFQIGLPGFYPFSVTLKWNHGMGFIPIGSITHPFTGTFDGNNQDALNDGIWYTNINRPNDDNIGLFGVTGPSAVISDLIIFENAVTGRNNVGLLVGTNNGTIDNVHISQSFVVGNDNVGTIAGVNNGTISNSSVFSNRTIGDSNVGGIAGNNTGLIENSIATNYIGGNSNTGGIAGVNSGMIHNSFWDTDATGQSQAVGLNNGIVDHTTGGCLRGNCTNSGVANLSEQATYETGSGYVDSSWDFNNIWTIGEGTTYPYSKILYDDAAGGPSTVYAGFTGAPNQVLIMIWGISDNSGASIGYTAIGNTVTGADGSFYILWGWGNVLDQDLVLLDLLGGNATGSIAFRASADPISGNTNNLTNIQIPTTLSNNPSNSNLAFSQTEILGIFAGIPLAQLAGLDSNSSIIQLSKVVGNLYKSVNLLFNFNQQLYRSYLSALASQYGLAEEVKKFYATNHLNPADPSSILAFQRYLDNKLVNSYDIKQIAQKYCQ